ncbi:hypothetical protein SLEP1_g23510 [Rubroshorea leprosula]|uniref:Alpha/beta hydrolase fold-3 domain-containing protein n=1 Tax=Rubroshorea leprosula TaxID=152421 RepID=A0AAV5JPP4_9ROSI|nr:hypothetical protein SLEP1_g23510 [Rubroshorea leprosula]
MSANLSRNLSWKIRLYQSIVFGIRIFCRCDDGIINRGTKNLFDFKAPPSREPINGVSTFETTVDATHNLWFRLYIPSHTKDGCGKVKMLVIFYFHGGGFTWMNTNSIGCDNLSRRLSREIPAVTMSVKYRLSPKHKCPS